MNDRNYQVREIKKFIEKDEPLFLANLTLDGSYVATVEFNYFTSFCNIIDHEDSNVFDRDQICDAITLYVIKEIKKG